MSPLENTDAGTSDNSSAEGQAALNAEGQTNTPETVPYSRFSEVIAEKNEAKQLADQAQLQANQALQYVTAMQQQQLQTTKEESYDAFEEKEAFDADPRAYMTKMKQEIMGQLQNDVASQYQAQEAQRSALDNVIQNNPNLNHPAAVNRIKLDAQTLANQLQMSGQGQAYSWSDIYNAATKNVAELANLFSQQGSTSAQTRQQATQGAFAEGQGAQATKPSGDLDTKVSEALSKDDTHSALLLKLQKFK